MSVKGQKAALCCAAITRNQTFMTRCLKWVNLKALGGDMCWEGSSRAARLRLKGTLRLRPSGSISRCHRMQGTTSTPKMMEQIRRLHYGHQSTKAVLLPLLRKGVWWYERKSSGHLPSKSRVHDCSKPDRVEGGNDYAKSAPHTFYLRYGGSGLPGYGRKR